MLTAPYIVQQFLAACIGNTEEETNPSGSDAQQSNEHQTETEFATDDNSTGDSESAASDTSDTPVSKSSEIENVDAPPESEETSSEDDGSPLIAIDDDNPQTQPDSEDLPISINEEAHTSEDDTPDTPRATETPIVEIANLASSDDEATEFPEDTHPASEDKTESATETVTSEQENESAITQHAQVSDVEITATKTQETDGSDDTETEQKPTLLGLGIIEDIYDFVEMFGQSTVSGTDQASVSGTDCSGGVTKPAIFEHPTPTEAAKIDYTFALPDVDKKEKLFLHFSIGLRDGVAFDDAERQPGGVKFAIEIFDLLNTGVETTPERCFESVSTECQWVEESIELTSYAGKEVVISFLTECNIEGNSNFAWALWGKPQLRKLKEMSLRKGKRNTEPEFQCGIAILHFNNDTMRLREFSQPTSTRASDLANLCLESHAPEEPPVKISLYAAQPKLEIVNVGATAAVVTAGEDFEVQCTLRNIGTAPLGKADTARIAINGMKLRRGRPRQTIKEIEPGEEVPVSWIVRRFPNPTVTSISVSLKCQTAAGEERQTAQENVVIRPEPPKLAAKVVKELHTYTENGSVVLANKHLRIVFVRGTEATPKISNENNQETEGVDGGFGYCIIFVAKGGNYQQVATCPALSEVVYLDASQNRQTSQLTPTNYQLSGNNQGESIVRLSGSDTDVDGIEWTYEMQWTLSESATRVKTEYQLQTDGNRELLAFRGPMLYAGQGRHREKKTAALFPGLEFLENDERSSSTRDAASPFDNRLVPHPYKITVPVMAVEMQKSVVGIIWNPLETWDGENQMLSAVFASPNWHQYQKNHALGVFVPTVPAWVPENQTEASIPYPLKPSRPVSIKTEIIVDGNTSILDAIAHWNDAYGAPEPLSSPRSDADEVLLSRHGFMQTTWDEATRKSRHCVGWAPHNEPGFGTLLWYDYLATKDEHVKERVLEIAKNTITESGAGGLAARGSCHILRWEFPFYIGHINAGLSYMEEETQQRIATQESDGSWRWHPADAKTASLGTAGEAVLGTCAESALLLLKHARITGNKASHEAGLKALGFIQQFSVPRGAQMWECPMYQPDVLAAAHAIGAYVEAYELTADKEHLTRATYWAATALPFLYHWHLPDRPGMQFASIPVFGTSFHTHPWFGVPVQWNGLVLAYYLQRLNRHIEDDRWLQIAEGITVSAMYQQWDDGELKGTYPDGFYGFCTEGKGPHLNPEDIMVNVYTLRGVDPGIKTAIVGEIHLSSGAIVDGPTLTDNGQLKWQLSYADDETSYTLIVGYGRAPQALRARYQFSPPTDEPSIADADAPADASEPDSTSDQYAEIEIANVQTLEDVGSGWLYIKDKDAILVKYLHTTTDVQFEIV
ncbi:hypothetical protein J4G07_05385 [Candidatus Poribacteria bacterium]|nr:hypothetical protein [Candidatus Poribacteria bacterium]